jgi:hypothetical protein
LTSIVYLAISEEKQKLLLCEEIIYDCWVLLQVRFSKNGRGTNNK